jgi:hypothetical protein
MSGRRLDLTQRQVRALCEGAKKAGCVAVIEVGNVVVKLVPEEHVVHDMERRRVDEDDDFRL